jgi:hypothetical protein
MDTKAVGRSWGEMMLECVRGQVAAAASRSVMSPDWNRMARRARVGPIADHGGICERGEV